jgi:hypothetical protein
MEIFKTKLKMSVEQQALALEFEEMVEGEFALCVEQIEKTYTASTLSSTDFANREIDSICRYWQLRLANLMKFLDMKNVKLKEDLVKKYLKND